MAPDAGNSVASVAGTLPIHRSPNQNPGGPLEKQYDANFNAPIYPPFWTRVHDRFWVVMAQTAQIFYLIWRWHRFFTLPSSYWISIPFIVSETLIVMGGSFITYFMVWNQINRPKLRLNELPLAPKEYPTVDVMIPCYNEPVEVSITVSQLPCRGIWNVPV